MLYIDLIEEEDFKRDRHPAEIFLNINERKMGLAWMEAMTSQVLPLCLFILR